MSDTPMRVPPALLNTIGQACRQLNIGRTSLYRMISEGKLELVQVYGAIRIHQSELARIAREGVIDEDRVRRDYAVLRAQNQARTAKARAARAAKRAAKLSADDDQPPPEAA
jgi:excisionase family DNA binding protein